VGINICRLNTAQLRRRQWRLQGKHPWNWLPILYRCSPKATLRQKCNDANLAAILKVHYRTSGVFP